MPADLERLASQRSEVLDRDLERELLRAAELERRVGHTLAELRAVHLRRGDSLNLVELVSPVALIDFSPKNYS